MCNPILILYGATAVLTLAQGKMASDAAEESGKYAQAVANQNATVAHQQATDARTRGEQAAAEQRMRTRLLIGQQRAQLAGQGVDLSMGTPLDILGDTAMFGQIDEQRIRDNAAREAWGFDIAANDAINQGNITSYETKQQKRATALGTAANVASSAQGMYGGMGGGAGSAGIGGVTRQNVPLQASRVQVPRYRVGG